MTSFYSEALLQNIKTKQPNKSSHKRFYIVLCTQASLIFFSEYLSFNQLLLFFSRILGSKDSTFPAMSITSLRKSLCALKTWHNSLTFSVLDLKSKYLAAIPLFFRELVTETYGMLLSRRTNLMCRRSLYDCFSDSPQNLRVITAIQL